MEMMRMNMYVYAPKLDVKHRNNWRDLYSVEEAGKLYRTLSIHTYIRISQLVHSFNIAL